MDDLLQVGAVTSPHGLKGEVKVYPTTDDPQRFKKLKSVLLDRGKNQEYLELSITHVKFFKQMVILKFKGYDHINDVEAWRRRPLYVTREHAVALEKDEYFIADLIGVTAVSDEGEVLGMIRDVIQTGANDVYVITSHSEDLSQKKPDLLVPAIKDCILDVDLQEKTMKIHLLHGLRE